MSELEEVKRMREETGFDTDGYVETTIVYLLRERSVEFVSGHSESRTEVLLKQAVKGISKGKWNGLGGKIERSDANPEASAAREVHEESGLVVQSLIYHGMLLFNFDGKPGIACYVYSTKDFQGSLKESDEGKLNWFDLLALPFNEMWPDDRYWLLDTLLDGAKLRGTFDYADSKVMHVELSRHVAKEVK